MSMDPVEASAVRAYLHLSEADDAALGNVVLRGKRTLKQRMGTANYEALVAQTLELEEEQAGSLAGVMYAASFWYSSLVPPAGDRSVASGINRGTYTEQVAPGDDVGKTAAQLRNQADHVLREAGLFSPQSTLIGTAIEIDIEEEP